MLTTFGSATVNHGQYLLWSYGVFCFQDDDDDEEMEGVGEDESGSEEGEDDEEEEEVEELDTVSNVFIS